MYDSAEDVFLKDEHRLSAKQAQDLLEELAKNDIGYAFVSTKEYRLGNKVLDYERLKKEYPDIEFAPSYEDDPDEPDRNGHK